MSGRTRVIEQLEDMSVASGQRTDIGGYVVERPHVGYWSLTPDPFDGCGVYPAEYVADFLASSRERQA